LNIDEEIPSVLFSSRNVNLEFWSIDWDVEQGELVLGMNSEEHRLMTVLSRQENTLTGSFTQYGRTSNITFARLSEVPQFGELARAFVSVPFETRIAQLNEFPDFADDGTQIVFTYDLNRRDLYMDLIEEFGLDELTAGFYDVDLMVVLLNWVKDNFRHNGASGLPRDMDAMSIINYMRENPAGINCRGLAVLLAEVLRLYGIEAKHITVHPPENDHPVHVITHAFSRELNQWIMLDPTFRIYLLDADGNFMNLYTLRQAFANGTPLFHNYNAGHNDNPFYLQQFKNFMADYMFRFSTGTNFTFGSEETGADTSQFMLVPAGFTGAHAQNITTSAEAFFALPSN
jgi:hypothetical protein